MKIIKELIVLLLISNLLLQVYCEGTTFTSNYKLTESAFKKSHKNQEAAPSSTPGVYYDTVSKARKDEAKPLTQDELNKDDLKDVPIYYQTWIKYFKYLDEKTAEKPKHFFKNPLFEKQTEIKTDSDKVLKLLNRMAYYLFLMKNISSPYCIRII
jgi:hypothetical protein